MSKNTTTSVRFGTDCSGTSLIAVLTASVHISFIWDQRKCRKKDRFKCLIGAHVIGRSFLWSSLYVCWKLTQAVIITRNNGCFKQFGCTNKLRCTRAYSEISSLKVILIFFPTDNSFASSLYRNLYFQTFVYWLTCVLVQPDALLYM